LYALPVVAVYEGVVGGFGEPDPLVVRVPAHAADVTVGHAVDVDQLVVAALPVPDLVTGVAGVHEDRADCARGPTARVAVRVPGRIRGGGRGDAVVVEVAGDARIAGAGESFGEDSLHDRCRGRVGFEAVQGRADACFSAVGCVAIGARW
jgi:hypothetical protein